MSSWRKKPPQGTATSRFCSTSEADERLRSQRKDRPRGLQNGERIARWQAGQFDPRPGDEVPRGNGRWGTLGTRVRRWGEVVARWSRGRAVGQAPTDARAPLGCCGAAPRKPALVSRKSEISAIRDRTGVGNGLTGGGPKELREAVREQSAEGLRWKFGAPGIDVRPHRLGRVAEAKERAAPPSGPPRSAAHGSRWAAPSNTRGRRAREGSARLPVRPLSRC